MVTVAKNSQFSFRTDEALIKKAKEIVKAEDLDMTTLFNNLLIKVVDSGKVPALLLDQEKSKKERVIDELYAEIQEGYVSYLAGHGKSAEEVFSKYGL